MADATTAIVVTLRPIERQEFCMARLTMLGCQAVWRDRERASIHSRAAVTPATSANAPELKNELARDSASLTKKPAANETAARTAQPPDTILLHRPVRDADVRPAR